MNKTQYIGFHSPKTAGTTTIATNIAFLKKQISEGENIAFLQIAKYGDLDLHIGAKSLFNFSYLNSFIGTAEFKTQLLSKIAVSLFGVDFYSSPTLPELENLSLENLEKIMNLLSQKYDKIFIDLGNDISPEIMDFFLTKLHKIILVGTLAPISFRTIELFKKEKKLSGIKTYYLLNQCPSETVKDMETQLKKLDIEFLGVVPQDTKSCWFQTYEGFLCGLRKRSKLKKALISISEKL